MGNQGQKVDFGGSAPYIYFRFRRYGHRDGRFCLIFARTAQQSVLDGTMDFLAANNFGRLTKRSRLTIGSHRQNRKQSLTSIQFHMNPVASNPPYVSWENPTPIFCSSLLAAAESVWTHFLARKMNSPNSEIVGDPSPNPLVGYTTLYELRAPTWWS